MISAGPVSVIVPCLNAERTLAAALESVWRQTVPPIEVLVIDDGSRDRSVAVARSFGPRVRVLRNVGRGPGAARRLGVQQARGEYIAFVDADDWLEPAKHEKQLAVFAERGPEILVHTDAMLIYEDGSRPDTLRRGAEAATGRCTQLIFESNPVCGASTMLAREVILRLGNYDAELLGTEDYAMTLAASTCCELVHIPEPLYRIRRHATNITRRRCLMAYYHWTAQEKFRQRFPESFAAIPAEVVQRAMIEPVLSEVRAAYWRRDGDGYLRLLRLARALAPADPVIRMLWRRRWCPMALLRWQDRLRLAVAAGCPGKVT